MRHRALGAVEVVDMEALRGRLTASMAGPRPGRMVAERLCAACVELFEVDGAAVSVMYDEVLGRPYAASGPLCGELGELQFTLGEGPAVEAVSTAWPALRADLNDPRDSRWPGYTSAALQRGVQAVFALPVYVGAVPVGALEL